MARIDKNTRQPGLKAYLSNRGEPCACGCWIGWALRPDEEAVAPHSGFYFRFEGPSRTRQRQNVDRDSLMRPAMNGVPSNGSSVRNA